MNQIFKVLDACKADYVKWDMNRSVDNVFSAALPKERQGEVYHRYVLAVYEMMEAWYRDIRIFCLSPAQAEAED